MAISIAYMNSNGQIVKICQATMAPTPPQNVAENNTLNKQQMLLVKQRNSGLGGQVLLKVAWYHDAPSTCRLDQVVFTFGLRNALNKTPQLVSILAG
ncbi:MAG TPA: hypothetical protein EYN66_21245 [Myxococcales bacterium]|nr:hypothetical protein [Myxococcales bacterium]